MKDEDNWNYDEQKYLGLVIENQLLEAAALALSTPKMSKKIKNIVGVYYNKKEIIYIFIQQLQVQPFTLNHNFIIEFIM